MRRPCKVAYGSLLPPYACRAKVCQASHQTGLARAQPISRVAVDVPSLVLARCWPRRGEFATSPTCATLFFGARAASAQPRRRRHIHHWCPARGKHPTPAPRSGRGCALGQRFGAACGHDCRLLSPPGPEQQPIVFRPIRYLRDQHNRLGDDEQSAEAERERRAARDPAAARRCDPRPVDVL